MGFSVRSATRDQTMVLMSGVRSVFQFNLKVFSGVRASESDVFMELGGMVLVPTKDTEILWTNCVLLTSWEQFEEGICDRLVSTYFWLYNLIYIALCLTAMLPDLLSLLLSVIKKKLHKHQQQLVAY